MIGGANSTVLVAHFADGSSYRGGGQVHPVTGFAEQGYGSQHVRRCDLGVCAGCGDRRRGDSRAAGAGHLQVVGAVFLLVVVAFCAFGFLATFEPPGVPARLVYIAFGTASLLGAGRLVAPGTASAVTVES